MNGRPDSRPLGAFVPFDAIEHSWSLKLAWLCVPEIPVVIYAAVKHGGLDSRFIPATVAAALLIGFAPSIVKRMLRPLQRARRRALSPLQRMQMSEEMDYQPLEEILGIDQKPAFTSLPPVLQVLTRRFGRPAPGLGFVALLVSIPAGLLLAAMALLDDPIALASRLIGAPWPLSYWTTFLLLLSLILGFRFLSWLRQMHDHYAAEAKTSGRSF